MAGENCGSCWAIATVERLPQLFNANWANLANEANKNFMIFKNQLYIFFFQKKPFLIRTIRIIRPIRIKQPAPI
jgi:hypothetical protein